MVGLSYRRLSSDGPHTSRGRPQMCEWTLQRWQINYRVRQQQQHGHLIGLASKACTWDVQGSGVNRTDLSVHARG